MNFNQYTIYLLLGILLIVASLATMTVIYMRMMYEKQRYTQGKYRYRDECDVMVDRLRPYISFCGIPLVVGLLLVMGSYILSL